MPFITESSRYTEYYTPPHILDAVKAFYGGAIDTDPCSNSLMEPNVPARYLWTADLDGLKNPWIGRVFINPPYGGREFYRWIEKAWSELKEGIAKEIIFLLPCYSDLKWFLLFRGCAFCFLRGRLTFRRGDGKPNSKSVFASVLVYMGPRHEEFCRAFYDLGVTATGDFVTTNANHSDD